ncbi:MAG: hypothetical protein HXS48_05850 [Theionarchaea archaeon]|nr:MAG: hypothetical protein AYK19_11375 [Theionarchaea archaeon DG-70-1]MBU7026446.1 hypothetical protein [Theionarchaea archaeon]
MPLKRNWPNRKKEEEKHEKPDLYTQLKQETQIVRKQGEPPEKDPLAFSKYVCDLCSTTHTISELKQCAVCGRWACESCWTSKYYLCNSCSGIVALKSIKL